MDDDLERVDLDSVLAGVHVCRVRSSMLWPMVEGQVRCLAPALDPSYSIKTKKKMASSSSSLSIRIAASLGIPTVPTGTCSLSSGGILIEITQLLRGALIWITSELGIY